MKMVKPKISVIIPAYNAEEYIGKCLDSVLAQDFNDFEVLVINDGSIDDTGKILNKYAKKDKRIKYFEQNNMGVARTRNKAIGLARGEFITFIDNDDYIDKDYLDVLLPRNNEEIVISGFRRPDKNGKIVKAVKLANTDWSRFVVPTPWAKVYRKDFILKNKIKFLDNNIGEDIFFNLTAMLKAKKIKTLDYVGYNWFYNDESISNTQHKDFSKINVFKLLNSCYDELKKQKLLENNYNLVEFFFYRFIAWFLFYSSKEQKKNEIDKMYDKLFNWLEMRFPRYKKNPFLRGKLEGEERMTRYAYLVLMLGHKLGFGKMVVWAYARL